MEKKGNINITTTNSSKFPKHILKYSLSNIVYFELLSWKTILLPSKFLIKKLLSRYYFSKFIYESGLVLCMNGLIEIKIKLNNCTRAVQKIRAYIFNLFFGATLKNKLPRGECSRGLYDHNVRIWTLCMFLIVLRSSKSEVASSWCCQIWDVCGNKFFTCWRSTSYWNWNTICENNHSQSLATLRFPLEWVHWDVQTYSIQSTTMIVLLKGIWYLLEEQL